MHRGLQFQVNYTLAEARANYGDLLSGGGFGPGFRGYDLQGWGGLDNEWGLAYFHTKHALTFNGMWELPGKGALLGGWNVSWVLFAYSGQPQTIGCTVADVLRRRDASPSSSAIRTRANTTSRSSTTRTPSGIPLPPPRSGRRTSRRWAASARRSPGLRSGNWTWPVVEAGPGEGTRVELRVEAFNVIQHAELPAAVPDQLLEQDAVRPDHRDFQQRAAGAAGS